MLAVEIPKLTVPVSRSRYVSTGHFFSLNEATPLTLDFSRGVPQRRTSPAASKGISAKRSRFNVDKTAFPLRTRNFEFSCLSFVAKNFDICAGDVARLPIVRQ